MSGWRLLRTPAVTASRLRDISAVLRCFELDSEDKDGGWSHCIVPIGTIIRAKPIENRLLICGTRRVPTGCGVI